MERKILTLMICISGIFSVTCDANQMANTANTSGNRVNIAKTKELEEKVTFLVPKSSANFPVAGERFLNAGGNSDLRAIAENLKTKLNNAGYSKTRFHKINNGFAIVTGVQRFSGEDWNSLGEGEVKVTAKDFDEYKKYLVNGKKMFYRFVVLTVTTDENPEDEEKTPTFEQALTWAVKKTSTSSTKTTSPNMKDLFDQPFTNEYECIAHIYVFEKNYTIDSAQFVSVDMNRAQNYLDNITK